MYISDKLLQYIPLISVGLIILGYILGRKHLHKIHLEEKFKTAKSRYDQANMIFKCGNYIEAIHYASALIDLNMAISIDAWIVIGVAYAKLEKYGNASEALDQAFFLGKQYKINRKDLLYLYHDSALNHLKNNNWEFVYLRAREAITYLANNPLQQSENNMEIEERLKMFKILGAFMFLSINEKVEQVKDEINWILGNSSNTRNKNFIQILLKYPEQVKLISNNIIIGEMIEDWAKDICYKKGDPSQN
ncbi:MAG: hypothetical protein HYT97_04635 [Elusimicrobia bacterium]|nr:hypothetical protein [Elusimicrobiota bacterium]